REHVGAHELVQRDALLLCDLTEGVTGFLRVSASRGAATGACRLGSGASRGRVIIDSGIGRGQSEERCARGCGKTCHAQGEAFISLGTQRELLCFFGFDTCSARSEERRVGEEGRCRWAAARS